MAMPSASATPGATHAHPPTLRSLLEVRRVEGRRFSLEEAVAVIVPVCLDLQDRHKRGERLFVHPSSIAPGADGLARVNPLLASAVPSHPHDRHCIAPELQRTGQPGDACASVFALGAMMYEMVTGHPIGPAMKRPRDVDPSLPEALEILVGKSIIGDRAHRPADLGAFASALYHVAPQKSIHPPDISAARLDASAELEVDVKFSSMLPPGEGGPRSAPEASGVNTRPTPSNMAQVAADPYGGPGHPAPRRVCSAAWPTIRPRASRPSRRDSTRPTRGLATS